jgi:hypothetical protein
MSFQRRDGDRPDDVDRVFARLRSVPPPPDLTARILRALPAKMPSAPARQAQPVRARRDGAIWSWASLGTIVIFVALCVSLGGALEDSGSLSMLGEIFGNFGDFFGDPGGYLQALVLSLPPLGVIEIVLALAALGAFWWTSSLAVDRASRTRVR